MDTEKYTVHLFHEHINFYDHFLLGLRILFFTIYVIYIFLRFQ